VSKTSLQCIVILLYTLTGSISAEQLVLKNVNLVDVHSLSVVPEQAIVIEANRITQIIKSKQVRRAKERLIIDMQGKYVIPGLIDAHVHHATDPDNWDNPAKTAKRLRQLLRGGVTGVRDMGGDSRVLSYLKRQAEVDVIQSPDIYFSVIIGGPEFFSDPRTKSSAKGHKPGDTVWMRAVTEKSDFESIVLQAKGLGATGIKIYAKVSDSVLPLLATAAKKHGLKVWSHAFIDPAKPQEIVEAGVEVISHAPDLAAELIDNYRAWRRQNADIDPAQETASFVAANYQPLLARMKARGTILDATLTVFHERKNSSKNAPTMYQHASMLTRLCHQAGIKIAAGTDAFSDLSGKSHPMIIEELKLLVRDGGLTPFEALKSATLINAEVIGIEKETGSIKEGKIANLVLLDSDPTRDIENLLSVAHVIKNGTFIYRGDDQRLPFTNARKAAGMLYLSGQIGNLPTTMTLASKTIEGQMRQTMNNIGDVIQEHGLTFDDLTKCTVMLADIKDWPKANEVYREFFAERLPTRSAFAASGLALDAKVEVECLAEL